MNRFVACNRISGLGDVMHQAIHALILARRLGYTVFVDWRRSLYTDPSTRRNLFGTHIFHPDLRAIEDIDELDADPGTLATLRSGVYPNSVSADEFTQLLSGERSTQGRGVFLADNVGPIDRAEHYPHMARFHFDAETTDVAARFVDDHGIADAIGVHYRHGNGEFANIKSDGYTEGEIKRLCGLILALPDFEPGTRVFVACDSILGEDLFRKHLPHGCVVVAPKEHMPPGAGALHYAALANDIGNDFVHRSLRPTLIDMIVLSQCRRIYRDRYSSFSNWSCARFLHARGRPPDHIVEYPYLRRKASTLSSAAITQSVRIAKGSQAL